MSHDMRVVLDLVEDFQSDAEKVMRYEGNPFVNGNSVAEHLARAGRLLTYISPGLQKEFPGWPTLIGDIFTCLMIHDDEEVIKGRDIPTAIKVHNAKDEEEIAMFAEAVSVLPEDTRDFLVQTFSSFRRKNTLAAKIAKAVDNIAGNQLVIEQVVGLINPDSARFCIEYVQKVTGISQTVDALVAAQIDQVVEGREGILLNEDQMNDIEVRLGIKEKGKVRRLLQIDVLNHELDRSKVYTTIDEW